jgi:hypothetical protein
MKIWQVVTLMLLATNCGDGTDFSGSAATSGAGEANPKGNPVPGPGDGNPGDEPPYSNVFWFWQCAAAPAQVPVAQGPNELVIEGQGNHDLDFDRIQSTPVTISGKVCPPQVLPRDIMFVIDVSGSMATNDPPVGNTCGRRQAFEAVVSKLNPASDFRIGLVTFDDDVVTQSTLHASQASLYAEVTAGGVPIEQILCGVGSGTDYKTALTGATASLSAGRAQASKEIYFISDGRPNLTEEGIPEATVLKNTGVGNPKQKVIIATVMLGGTDTVLEQSIASRDSDGRPLHAYVAQAANLADSLSKLAQNDIIGGQVKYRAVGTTEWTVVELIPHLNNYEFELPSITLDVAEAPNGIELQYEYFDRRGTKFTSGGVLTWSQAQAALH